MLLFALTVILMAVGVNRMHDALKQRQLIALIQSYGGENHHDLNFQNGLERTIRFPNMEFSPRIPGPLWLRRYVGNEYFVSVAEAFFDKGSHRVLNDAMFLEFASTIRSKELPRPRGLVFSDLPITDDALEALSTFPNLTSLHILGCPNVTDAGLEQVGTLEKLRRLNLGGSSITDRGIARLSNLRDLRELSLSHTAVTDEGLLHLEGLHNLEWLALRDTRVTIDGIKALNEKLPECEIGW
jgi:Leucine-rich repeat (LRR) protein